MTTFDDLAARVAAQDARVARIEAILNLDKPAPTPPDPAPVPAERPSKPTGLACQIGPDGRPDLRWDPAVGVVAWELHDLAAPAPTLRATVTEPRSIRSVLKAGQHRRYTVVAVGPGGRSDPSDPIDVPPAPGPAPAPDPASPGTHPYDLIGGDWYLTTPIGTPGSPKTVELPALKTYSDEHFKLTPAGDGVIFTAPCGGVTTKNSTYPRSELRQMNGAAKADWGNAGAGQTLTVEQAFTKLPTVKPECCGAQIHDAKSDVIEIHLSGKRLTCKYNDGKSAAVLDENYVLGTRYRLQIIATQGRIKVIYNGVQKADLPISGSGWYWKTGAYVQSNVSKGDRPDAAGEVVVYSVSVT